MFVQQHLDSGRYFVLTNRLAGFPKLRLSSGLSVVSSSGLFLPELWQALSQ